jgi:hypothetical protein
MAGWAKAGVAASRTAANRIWRMGFSFKRAV